MAQFEEVDRRRDEKKGKLHEALHVPKDEKIPAAKLHAAAKKGGKIGKEARLAETLKGLKSQTFLIPLIPAKAGTQTELGAVRGAHIGGEPAWVPAFAGMSGWLYPRS